MEKILIRYGRQSDDEAIMHVHRRSILRLGRASYTEAECKSWSAGVELGRYQVAMNSGGETFLVAEANEKLVGFCSYKDDEIVGLYVDPTAARRGIGTQLLLAAEDEIATLSPTSIRLKAALSALVFYQSNGYGVVCKQDWTTKGGLRIDVCQMTKKVA